MKIKRSKSLTPEPSGSSESKKPKLEVDSYLNLQDFCDDILLNILKYLSPPDLLALSLCSQRMSQLTEDRTLWKKIDFRKHQIPLKDIEKYIKFFQPTTTSLSMRGDLGAKEGMKLTQKFFRTLTNHCTQLKELIIEKYYIDGNKIEITDFPETLEKLSFAGCQMDHLQTNKSYFFKIDLHMTNLTCLILSHCQWLLPHSLLVISKIAKLKELRMNSCRRLGECVAYSSLATRFGFKKLETLDLRDTALGDSEVSCFSGTKTLKHLYLEYPANFINYRDLDPPFEDGNFIEYIPENHWDNEGHQGRFISDRAIRAIGTTAKKVIHTSPHGILILEEENRIFNNPPLKTLVVRNYSRITNSSLIYLSNHILSLETLDVTGTSVTKQGVQTFKSKRPNVKIISSFDDT
ncbi:uncharacterized protein LOC122519249 [Polistes fuscatus]|uniref:uncharacterized protein LOC122519249 n=1 Tax=Polistes fuscatus TaxID=30207 RepID=UPI001CA97654|nr:uncharacterized protein LOC122519249 [Polistes fuscatus]XP_043494528.1 uncharacterized protein LOC122519249 [Polistes fuscatus]